MSERRINKLRSRYEKLEKEYKDLEVRYKLLQKDRSKLMSENDYLKDQVDDLTEENKLMISEYACSVKEMQESKMKYDAAVREYISIKNTYKNEFEKLIQEMREHFR